MGTSLVCRVDRSRDAAPALELLCRLAGQPVPFCFVWMHRDRTLHPNPDVPWIVARECILCHRIHDPKQYAPRSHPERLAWIAAGQGK